MCWKLVSDTGFRTISEQEFQILRRVDACVSKRSYKAAWVNLHLKSKMIPSSESDRLISSLWLKWLLWCPPHCKFLNALLSTTPERPLLYMPYFTLAPCWYPNFLHSFCSYQIIQYCTCIFHFLFPSLS